MLKRTRTQHSVTNHLWNERINRVNSEGDSFLTLTWPDIYPANCPPADAKPASGTIYRLVRQDPAQAQDFKSNFEESLENPSINPSIKNCGLSVHTDSQDSEQLKKRVGKFRSRLIAKSRLSPTLGMIRHTASIEESHHTWWVPVEAKPWTVFNIMSR